MTSQAATFYANGIRLVGTFTSATSGGVKPAIICVHGYTGRKETYMPSFVRDLTAAGYHTLDFYHRGFGDSDGTPRRVDPEEQVRDILAARVWLSARDDVGQVAVMGLSHGGGASIKATAVDPEIVALATVGAPGNGERWHRSKRTSEEWDIFQLDLAVDRVARALTGEGRTLPYQEMSPPGPAEREAFKTMYKTEDAYPDGYPIENVELACGFNAEDWVGQISPRPLLLIHGEKDTMVRHVEAENLLARAGEPKELYTIPDINHAEVYEPRNPTVYAGVMEKLMEFYNGALCQ
ncbi:MAG: alpha/beta hydrolase [Alphaproteobacteria bacterium]|nr:alpha/beta hydrolase [Alphaproteobacteria bacterium]